MCLIFVSYNSNAYCRYVIAANRDEFRCRATAPLGYIDGEKTILGGKDLQAGGMWLGASRGGKFGAITNYRDGSGAGKGLPSRGEIVSEYLHCTDSALSAIERLAKNAQRYAGFNVLFGDDSHLVYYSNMQKEVRILEPGFYGLSNHLLDTPWPKVVKGKGLLQVHMCGQGKINAAEITKLLGDTSSPVDAMLPATGVSIELERFLGTIFIDGADYGTRSTAVIEIGYLGDVIFTETSYIHGVEMKNTSQKRMEIVVDR